MPTLVEQSPDFVPLLPSTTVTDDFNYHVENGDFKFRNERQHKGLVRWRPAKSVPDIGGTGFVNRTRAEQMDRFWRQKRSRMRLERATSWTPHSRAKKEFHDFYDTFDGDVNSLPYWALRKILTEEVIAGDRRAIDNITSKFMREDAFKRMLKAWRNNRRVEIMSDYADRCEYNERLQQMAGQPTAERQPRMHTRPIVTARLNELSKAKEEYATADVTAHTNFRGLPLIDNAIGLEKLKPGQGKNDSLMVKEKVLQHVLSVRHPERLHRPDRSSFPSPEPLPTEPQLHGIMERTPLATTLQKEYQQDYDRGVVDDEIKRMTSCGVMLSHFVRAPPKKEIGSAMLRGTGVARVTSVPAALWQSARRCILPATDPMRRLEVVSPPLLRAPGAVVLARGVAAAAGRDRLAVGVVFLFGSFFFRGRVALVFFFAGVRFFFLGFGARLLALRLVAGAGGVGIGRGR
eukprot:g3183.t1